MGVLMRAHGLSCDNLRSVEIVTADGAVRTASREEHPDLFWAARGGGRGLGVVTSFEFDVHPLGPRVAMAQVLYPYADAGSVVRAWRDLVPRLPETASPPSSCSGTSPRTRTIPAEMHGCEGRDRRRRACRPRRRGRGRAGPAGRARHPAHGHERDGGLRRRRRPGSTRRSLPAAGTSSSRTSWMP